MRWAGCTRPSTGHASYPECWILCRTCVSARGITNNTVTTGSSTATVACHGMVERYGSVFKKVLAIKNQIVEVIIAPREDGLLSIADAWVKTR